MARRYMHETLPREVPDLRRAAGRLQCALLTSGECIVHAALERRRP